tara:strand:- start:29 stop:553 length:525 start_codon:yes stop_codon:yes gene_type:complete
MSNIDTNKPVNFDLDNAIKQWCSWVLSLDSIHNKNIEELSDHLYCLIEGFIKQGETEQSAFALAVDKMGDVDSLAAEYQKNRTWLNKLCAFEYGTVGEHAAKKPANKKLVINQSILWAAAMLASSLVIADKQDAIYLIFSVLLPLSIVNILAINGNHNKMNISCFKSKLAKWFN